MDDELGDFFAKKDKSKKKVKNAARISVKSSDSTAISETTTIDPTVGMPSVDGELIKDFETVTIDSAKEKKLKEKKKPMDLQEAEDDDWDVIDNRVDYSGLKIASKNIAWEKKMADKRAAAKRAAEKAAGLKATNAGKTWDKPKEVQPPAQQIREAKPDPELPNVSSGRYVPPSQRGGAPELKPISLKRQNGRGMRAAPNLQSSKDFPTLGGAILSESVVLAPAAPRSDSVKAAKSDDGFQAVRGSASSVVDLSQQHHRSSAVESIKTSNKFSALGN